MQLIDLSSNTQKEPWYTALSPNGMIPTIVDHDKDGHAVMESFAILNYLVTHYDKEKRFFGFDDPLERCTADQWLAWQHGGLGSSIPSHSLLRETPDPTDELTRHQGPTQAQAMLYYRFLSTRFPFPAQKSVSDTERHYGVLNTRLADRDYVAGSGRGTYSIVDIATWPFIDASLVAGIEIDRFPNVRMWWERVWARDAVKKGMRVPSGEDFRFGLEKMEKSKVEDKEGWEKSERPLREALESAQKEFGYVFRMFR